MGIFVSIANVASICYSININTNRREIMNGEIQQASNIVISARKALFDNKEIDFTPSKYELSIQFLFIPKFLCRKSVKANSVCERFKRYKICSPYQ